MGMYLESFQPFYGPKEAGEEMSEKERIKVERDILEQIQQTIKEVRSNSNSPLNFKFSPNLKLALVKLLDFFEDKQAGRINEQE